MSHLLLRCAGRHHTAAKLVASLDSRAGLTEVPAMHPALRILDHRPWPLPERPWLLGMEWLKLAFIHYPIDAATLRPLLPPGLRVDEFAGSAWLGIVPFQMASVAPRLLPAVPGLSTFPEINLRTYVVADGRPGVWFFSLDADSRATVFGGRTLFDLPYFSARITLTETAQGLAFASVRRGGEAIFRGRYHPRGEIFFARPGTFEHWATERYCLYAHSPSRGLRRLEVQHPPWPLQLAEVEVATCTLPAAFGLPALPANPICHYSPGVPVVSFGPAWL